MPASDPDERRALAQRAANTRWGVTVDRTAATRPARDAWIAKIASRIPDEVADPRQRAAMLQNLLAAEYSRLAAASRRARARRNADQALTETEPDNDA